MRGPTAQRVTALLLMIAAILLLTACGGGNSTAPIPPPPPPSSTVTITPSSANVAAGSAMQFSSNMPVIWQVNGTPGGTANTGTIDSSGFYQAPDLPMTSTVTIQGILQADATKVGSATVNVTLSNSTADPLGAVNATSPVPCNQVLGGDLGSQAGTVTCYTPVVSCPGVADEMVGIKVNAPAGSSKGLITMETGGGGSLWYDQLYTYGMLLVDQLVNQYGYTTVQENWGFVPVGYPANGSPNGWLSGPGGPRKLACRWATVTRWVHDNLRPSSTTPMCHTGNSGGAGAAAYALVHYGFDALQIFNFVEETGGPPFVRIDQGCICNTSAVFNMCTQQSQTACYGPVDSQMVIDPAYDPVGGATCSGAAATQDTTNRLMFLNDSLLSPDANLSYPHTNINFAFGDQDLGPEAIQNLQWWSAMTPSNGNQQPWTCVPNTTHQMPDFQQGAHQIELDLAANCH
jgi:hypothetical protein